MSIVSEMVRHLALIVLLAVFVEMLLPAGDLSRFVRLVMGLFVVAAVLTSLWQMVPRLAPAEVNLSFGEETIALDSIRSRAEALQRYQGEVALDSYRREISRQLTALVESGWEVTAQEVVVNLEENPQSPEYGAIRQLKVSLKAGSKPSDSIGVVPVEVEIRSSGRESLPGKGDEASATAVEIKSRLERFYDLSPGQIEVTLTE